jgi:hypothetical protein
MVGPAWQVAQFSTYGVGPETIVDSGLGGALEIRKQPASAT